MKKSAKRKASDTFDSSRFDAMTAEQRRAAAVGDPGDGPIIRLNAGESRRFAEMLARKPRKPRKHMLAALRNYRRLIQQDQSF